MIIAYCILTDTGGGSLGPAFWTEGDERVEIPEVFATREEAAAARQSHIEDLRQAEADGYMAEGSAEDAADDVVAEVYLHEDGTYEFPLVSDQRWLLWDLQEYCGRTY